MIVSGIEKIVVFHRDVVAGGVQVSQQGKTDFLRGDQASGDAGIEQGYIRRNDQGTGALRGVVYQNVTTRSNMCAQFKAFVDNFRFCILFHGCVPFCL